MQFFDLDKRKPKDGEFCLIKEWDPPRKRILLFCTTQQWDEQSGQFGFHERVVQWAPLPPHYLDKVKKQPPDLTAGEFNRSE